MKFRAKMQRYRDGVWAVGISLAHIPDETVLYIKLFKWYLIVGYMYEDWV